MTSRLCFLMFPLLAFAQEQPPPGVNDELMTRVDSFYHNFLETSWSPRKAETFVAEDTKDYFYNTSKTKYLSYKIGKITYYDNFTKATVVVVGKAERMMAAHTVVMDMPADTHWKIENGKWCWSYHPEDHPITPIGGMMGAKNPPEATPGSSSVVIPKSTNPQDIRSVGLAVLSQQPMGVDIADVTMNPERAASAKIVFTNGADGEIQIVLDGPVVRGMTAKLDKTTVPAHSSAVLTLRYDPSDKAAATKDVWEPKGNIPFRIVVFPFNRVFPISVTFIAGR